MEPASRLFAYVHAPREDHEPLLLGAIAPLVREIRGHPDLDSVSFSRTDTPDWLIRLLVRGRREWIEGAVRPRLREILRALERVAIVDERDLPGYRLEVRRWGGVEGILLAERTSHHDTLACLDWLELESRRLVSRTRREYSLLMTERLLDLLRLDRGQRLAFYRKGYAWPLEQGTWTGADLEALDRKFLGLRQGLTDLLRDAAGSDPVAVWGGGEAARVAERCLLALGPLADAWIEARDAGRLEADWIHLVWSLAHVHSIRLGIESVPEAILRYFMYRFHSEGAAPGHADALPGPGA
ncbi:MAG: thiopeptide-type bacteriocin biosynthesis protein [Acidobacteriia bacterium]|nr:thiopeptide-type bacteriocin biosynthesis protein [Terriglobia bacterium]